MKIGNNNANTGSRQEIDNRAQTADKKKGAHASEKQGSSFTKILEQKKDRDPAAAPTRDSGRALTDDVKSGPEAGDGKAGSTSLADENALVERGLKQATEREVTRELSERKQVGGQREERVFESRLQSADEQGKLQSSREHDMTHAREQLSELRDSGRDPRLAGPNKGTAESKDGSQVAVSEALDKSKADSGATPLKESNAAGGSEHLERAEVAKIAGEIVDAMHVGEDTKARKVVLMDVQVPGKGSVRIRLRRQGDSVEVRMRADNQDLARLLRSSREDLRESGAQKGLKFSSIQIVG